MRTKICIMNISLKKRKAPRLYYSLYISRNNFPCQFFSIFLNEKQLFFQFMGSGLVICHRSI